MLTDKIEKWIIEQEEAGKTRSEIHDTHFVYKDTIGVIKKTGRDGYNLEVYMNPKAVFFTD